MCDYTSYPEEIFNNIRAQLFEWSCNGRHTKATRSSADADKPAWRDYRSVKVTKHITIPYVSLVRYSFLLCNSNFVFKTRRFYDIRLQKCRDLENRVRGPSRSLEISPFDRAHTTSYWRSIITKWLYLVSFLRYSMSKNVVTLKSGVRGHSMSLKVVPFGRSCMVSY